MAPKFGTSGLRGLVTELTDDLVADHVRAFLATCDHGGRILVGWDLRPSSPHVAGVVARVAAEAGAAVTLAGSLPTPALALAASGADAGAVMVTGSHIPADRNGLKFYTRAGEIAKAEEAAITAALGRGTTDTPALGRGTGDTAALGRGAADTAALGRGAADTAALGRGTADTAALGRGAADTAAQGGSAADTGAQGGASDGAAPASTAVPVPGSVVEDVSASDRFVARYVTAFGEGALKGRRIGLYAHSAVGRDLLASVLRGTGAEVVELARSDVFIPVDTEAVDPATRAQLAGWAKDQGLDAIVSTDGDSDRPMLADEAGRVIPGDILGQVTAEVLGAETVVTPISSNSGVMRKPCFARVIRTRIGSPFVIAAMEEAGGRVAGYEANGGFLLGFGAQGPAGPLPALPTRDSFLPILAMLHAAGADPVSVRAAAEPPVFTAADRLADLPPEAMAALVADLAADPAARARFLSPLGATEAAVDLTDGVRMTAEDGRVLHVRPSGNAPELRLYVEAADPGTAEAALAAGLALLAAALHPA